MRLSYKVRVLNHFRRVFKLRLLENWLCCLTRHKAPDHFFSKLAPNAYQYRKPSLRMVNVHGLKMLVDISDYLGHYYYFGFADVSQSRLFSLCEANFNVIDVGTNIGFSLLRLGQLASDGRVIGFEPDPDNYRLCMNNVALNPLKNVSVHNLALGASNQNVNLEVRTPSNRGGNRIAPSDTVGHTSVEVRTLDSLFAELALDAVHLMKIDVEGYELSVLKGAESTIRRFKPILFIEVDDRNLRDQGDSATSLLTFLQQLGYTSFINVETNEDLSGNCDYSHCHFDIIAK